MEHPTLFMGNVHRTPWLDFSFSSASCLVSRFPFSCVSIGLVINKEVSGFFFQTNSS